MGEPSVPAFSITDSAGGSEDGQMQSSETVTISGTTITISGSSVTVASDAAVVIDADLKVKGNLHATKNITADGACC